MASQVIRVSSWALGEKRRVIVRVYESLAEMRAASDRFNGTDNSRAGGVTQAYIDDEGRVTVPVVRLSRSLLTNPIVSHELHHAATAIYGSAVRSDGVLADLLTHHNEEFAHLYSDLFGKTVDALHERGFFEAVT